MSGLTIYVPSDSSARAVGADDVADAVRREADRRGVDLTLIRTGSRGLYWLEPLVEIERDGVRYGYGPVDAGDVASLLDSGNDHPRALGPVERIPYLAKQTRVTFARCGVIDPLSLRDYQAAGGLTGLRAALAASGQAVIDAVKQSGLRGRGGAGFPTGIKWQTVADAPGDRKYIVCNADEGDSGTFADRMLMEGDPFTLIEGMIIAGVAVGAEDGFIYIRSEYGDALSQLERAAAILRAEGWLGPNVGGSGKRFDLHLRLGAGAYICGEETSLLESLEGKRGLVRFKPPLPAIEGLFGKPTVVNNVLSLATIPTIIADSGKGYAALGFGRSRGTQPVQLAGNVKFGGLIEAPFGLTLRELIYDFGGGTASGRPVRAVQVGGPLGAYFPDSLLDTPLDYEQMAAAGGMVGHGGIVVFDDTVDLAKQARFAMEFCAIESCGKCTPCRIGSTRGMEVIDKIVAGVDRDRNFKLLDDLCTTMLDGSLCALGGMAPVPVRSAVLHFNEDFHRNRSTLAAE